MKNILILDDDLCVIKVLTTYLEHGEYTVFQSTSVNRHSNSLSGSTMRSIYSSPTSRCPSSAVFKSDVNLWAGHLILGFSSRPAIPRRFGLSGMRRCWQPCRLNPFVSCKSLFPVWNCSKAASQWIPALLALALSPGAQNAKTPVR
jgi:hypothetical protein